MKESISWEQFQLRLLNILQGHVGEQNFAKWLAEVLGISMTAAYKKLSTQSKLTVSDLMILASKVQFSLDQAMASKLSPIPFMSDAIRRQPEHPAEYFQNLANHLEFLKDLKNLNYMLLANEVPVFHFMWFPELIYFKVFVWNYTVWQKDFGSKGLKYEPDLFRKDKSLNDAILRCRSIYYTFPGTEIWNNRMFDLILDQIKYFVHLRSFKSKNDIVALLDELYKLWKHLETMAESAVKHNQSDPVKSPPIRIYNNDLISNSETILVNSDQLNALFLSVDYPNIIRTHDKRMTDHSKNWLNQTLKHCNLISGEGERERQEVLQTYRIHFEKSEEEIQALMKYKSYG
ncbi:MAG: hypothetical protein IPH93_00130 [Saprospiraceae bacterium]|nr:hypothetical protein [Saprospiraceae bacterium]MBK7809919.1 hypothetical protein [Saprospiraceae bacterium]MBK9629524.1 hypothetical protein [Saprospiraceae bacterium]